MQWLIVAVVMVSQPGIRSTPARGLADVMRETDAGYAAMVGNDPTVAREHFGRASQLLDAATRQRNGAGPSTDFAQRWYELVANTYITAGWNEEAGQLIKHTLSLYPRYAPLYVARGSIIEMAVAFDWTDLRGGGPVWTGGGYDPPPSDPAVGRRRSRYTPTSGDSGVSRRTVAQLAQQLEPAAAEYRRALDLDPHLALARLHLGWVHLLEHDGRARDELVQALADATTSPDQYLAHLFLGALAEGQREWADALQHYEAARQIDSASQTTYVAASHVQQMLGHDEAARELAQAAARLPYGLNLENPWWTYRLSGVDQQLLQWLHEEAERLS